MDGGAFVMHVIGYRLMTECKVYDSVEPINKSGDESPRNVDEHAKNHDHLAV